MGYKVPQGSVTDVARELLEVLHKLSEMDRCSSNNVVRDFESALEGLIEYECKTRP